MNILIICSYYPPDATIAAVRPYMFSKYLAKKGHNVTVLCPGGAGSEDDRLLSSQDLGIQICSYMKKSAASGMLSRPNLVVEGPKRLTFLPDCIRNPIKKVYHMTKEPGRIIRQYKGVLERLKLLKAAVDELESQSFDVVFSTYSELENIFAGKYAAEKFQCKWLMDFRDPVAQRRAHGRLTYSLLRKVEKKAIQSADACTMVCHDAAALMAEGTGRDIITLYNGYDAIESQEQEEEKDDVLRFAYTGTLYYGEQSFDGLLKAIRHLQEEGKLNTQKVCIEYAGPNFSMLLEQAQKYGLESILVNHGYIDRKEVAKLQNRCDIYLVLSWNKEYSQGVMTGKFYEGIRAHKPILALITGSKPNSELYRVNEIYHYGFCHEESAGEEVFELLCQWVEAAYENRQQKKQVPFAPEQSLFEDFRYDNLTDKLEKICLELLERGRL